MFKAFGTGRIAFLLVLTITKPSFSELFDVIEPSTQYEFRLLARFSGEENWSTKIRGSQQSRLKFVKRPLLPTLTGQPPLGEILEKDLVKLDQSSQKFSRSKKKEDDGYLEWVLFQHNDFGRVQKIFPHKSPIVMLERPLSFSAWIRADGPPVNISVLISTDGRNIRPLSLGVFSGNLWSRPVVKVPVQFAKANRILGHRIFFHGIQAVRTTRSQKPSVVSMALVQILLSHDRKLIPGNQYIFD